MEKERFDLYFAGWLNKEIADIIINNNYNQLLSNANDRDNIGYFYEAKKNGWKGKLLLDSGAFSTYKSGKPVDLDAYINYLNENHEYLDYYIQVDDIPGEFGKPKTKEQLEASPQKSWENYLYMITKLKEPKKLLPVFHQGEDFKYLEQMLEYRDADGNPIDYICISSKKEFGMIARQNWYKKCYEIIQNSSNPNVKTHSLGTQSIHDCELYPFTSVDATSWILTASNGNINTKFGNIFISDRGLHKKQNIANNVSYEVFKKYIEDEGFNFDELVEKSLNRIKWNCHFLGEWAKVREYKGPKSFKKRRLF